MNSTLILSDPFALDVRVEIDTKPGEAIPACDTSNGCDPSCASACTSNA
ncbi:FxLD family lanthipeptide [Pseudonocardia eucalypti]